MIDDEEHERINSLLGSMQQRDEAQQRMASITHLTVTAWRCTACDSTTDKRRPACQVRQHSRCGHVVNAAVIRPCCCLSQTWAGRPQVLSSKRCHSWRGQQQRGSKVYGEEGADRAALPVFLRGCCWLMQGHEGKSVTVTKRWWTCTGCNHRFSTLGIKYPKTRCPNPR